MSLQINTLLLTRCLLILDQESSKGCSRIKNGIFIFLNGAFTGSDTVLSDRLWSLSERVEGFSFSRGIRKSDISHTWDWLFANSLSEILSLKQPL